MLEVLIFDWHGTLGDIRGYNPRKGIRKKYGVPKELYDRMNLDLFVAPCIDAPYIEDRLCKIIKVPATRENVHYILRGLTKKQSFNTYDEALEIIPAIRSEFHLKLALLSNIDAITLDSLTHNPVYEAFFKKYFDKLFFSCQYGLCKPDLRFFHMALDGLNVSAEKTMMIGDKEENDIQPAQRIGMRTFKVKMKNRASDDKTLKDLPDFIYSNVI